MAVPARHRSSSQAAAILGHAGREDGGLPGARRDLEALQLLDHGQDPLAPFELRTRSHVLPAEEKPQEVLGSYRLDLAPQSLGRVAMDASEQATFADLCPIFPGRAVWIEATPQEEAFRLQTGHRRVYHVETQSGSLCDLGSHARPQTAEMSTHRRHRGCLRVRRVGGQPHEADGHRV